MTAELHDTVSWTILGSGQDLPHGSQSPWGRPFWSSEDLLLLAWTSVDEFFEVQEDTQAGVGPRVSELEAQVGPSPPPADQPPL